MSQNNNIRRGLKATLTVATLFAFQPAAADMLTFNGLFYAGADTVHINNIAPNLAGYVYSGGLRMKDTTGPWTMGDVTTAQNASFMAWCLDIYDHMRSANYTLVPDSPVPSIAHGTLTAAKAEALERLASNNLAMVVDARTSSAFQLAAWEIMAESAANYNLGSGSFTAFQSALGAIGDANTPGTANYWLSHLGTATPTMELYIWRADVQGSTQDLAVFTSVPEPQTYAMILAGLGLIGFAAGRRKQKAA